MSKARRSLLWLLALALLRWPVQRLMHAVLPDAAVDPLPMYLAGLAASIVLLGLPAWQLFPWTSIRLRQRKTLWMGAVQAAAAALLTRAAMTPVDQAWQNWLKLNAAEISLPQSIPAAMLCILALMVIPAVVEECFFRGALLTSLLDGCHRGTAILLTTLSFTLMHGNAANLPSLLVLSLSMTLLMLYDGRIALPIAAHLLYNLTAPGWRAPSGWVSIICGAALLAQLMMLCVKQPRYAHQPMKWPDGLIAAAGIAVLAATYFV